MTTSLLLQQAANGLEHMSHEGSDGTELENLTVECLAHIRELNVVECYKWNDWPERPALLNVDGSDIGIDAVALRNDKKWVAIQCKARQLVDGGAAPITVKEMNSFLSASSNNDVFAARWIVSNTVVSYEGKTEEKIKLSGFPVKNINLSNLVAAEIAASLTDSTQNRQSMQDEAVAKAVEVLRAHELSDNPLPKGQARGKIILPCGAGKTRIALRIVEELTPAQQVSVVLCPSIALVSQLRSEFKQHSIKDIRDLVVCSDETAGFGNHKNRVVDREEKIANDSTGAFDFVDKGSLTTNEIAGCDVTTNPTEIAGWLKQRVDAENKNAINVVFSTYQSAERLSEGIKQSGSQDAFKVMICDEAHRTANLRVVLKKAQSQENAKGFALCHNQEAFPATYRVYQTATPKIYGKQLKAQIEERRQHVSGELQADWIAKDMDDEATFGVELYRRSYGDAVSNGWLSDYRIIAMGVTGDKATRIATDLIEEDHKQAELDAERSRKETGKKIPKASLLRKLPTTGDYLKGMAVALALGGGAHTSNGERVKIASCISFSNTILRSKAMEKVLQSEAVKQWVKEQLGDDFVDYSLRHLDASDTAATREEAKTWLKEGNSKEVHAITNVGIFGEGTDSPSLSAVAFLDTRKSPVDVTQAVGRAMRLAQDKSFGYVIVPVVIPTNRDAEEWLATSSPYEGWSELGAILQALRAHDSRRLEEHFAEIVQLCLPKIDNEATLLPVNHTIHLATLDNKQVQHAYHRGTQQEAVETLEDAAKTKTPLSNYEKVDLKIENYLDDPETEPTQSFVAKETFDQQLEISSASPKRGISTKTKIFPNGKISVNATKKQARDIANGVKAGVSVETTNEKKKRLARERQETETEQQKAFDKQTQSALFEVEQVLNQRIVMNLLEHSGINGERTKKETEMNMLKDAVYTAAAFLRLSKPLANALNKHYVKTPRSNSTKETKEKADGAVIASLIWLNAAMLQQRIKAGGWLGHKTTSLPDLSEVASEDEPVRALHYAWSSITDQDFVPVIRPAKDVLRVAESVNRLPELKKALRHIAKSAQELAHAYADAGIDYAGALFNEVMGDQSSDGAFFTRPLAAEIAARLTLDVLDPNNEIVWCDPRVLKEHKTLDLACGSGTLLAAVGTEIKRRAVSQGATKEQLNTIQKALVEETLKGLDINPVSLQLAATQLLAHNENVRYMKMGLHLMPYGGENKPNAPVFAGSLELFGQELICRQKNPRLYDDDLGDTSASTKLIKDTFSPDDTFDDPDVCKAAEDAVNAKIVIMNPPFTNNEKMGQKFGANVKQKLKSKINTLESYLKKSDSSLSDFLDKKSLGPRFAALADLCIDGNDGVFATILPTTALANTSGLRERLELARRFHIHTIVTCHNPHDYNLSQDTSINESVVIMQRLDTSILPPPPPPLGRLESSRLTVCHATTTKSKGYSTQSTWRRRVSLPKVGVKYQNGPEDELSVEIGQVQFGVHPN